MLSTFSYHVRLKKRLCYSSDFGILVFDIQLSFYEFSIFLFFKKLKWNYIAKPKGGSKAQGVPRIPPPLSTKHKHGIFSFQPS